MFTSVRQDSSFVATLRLTVVTRINREKINDMKYYDYDKAIKLIEENKESLNCAMMGMHEDWFWTGQTVWENGEFTRKFISNSDAQDLLQKCIDARNEGMSLFSDEWKQFEDCFIGGIMGSNWATPVIKFEFNDGSEKFLECCYGVQDIPLADKIEKQITWTSGCLSEGVQERIAPISAE